MQVDNRPNVRPGAKYFEWEAKGVPLRVELGPRDARAGQAVVVRRTGGEPTEHESMGFANSALRFVSFPSKYAVVVGLPHAVDVNLQPASIDA